LGKAIAKAPAGGGSEWPVEVVILEGVANPSARQLAAAGVDPNVDVRSVEALCTDEKLLNYDAIVAMTPGRRLLTLRRSVERLVYRTASPRRPVLATGFNGIIYESMQEGLLWRLGYDVVCVNSEKDRRTFSKICHDVHLGDESLVVSGVLLASRSESAPLRPRTHIGTVIFAPQAVVPTRRVERAYILQRLVEYARRHPERTVVVKPRSVPGERTFHVERYPYSKLWDEDFAGATPPSNLEFRYGPLHDHLAKADLLVTVSSTAVFEALSHGVRVCVLEDFGLRERMGTQFFTGSGINANFDDLMEDRIPLPDPNWLRDNGFGGTESLTAVAHRVRRLSMEIGVQPVRFQDCYYTAERTPQVIKELDGGVTARSQETPNAWSMWAEDALDRAHRKARKLVRDPKSFVEDSSWLRTLRRFYSRPQRPNRPDRTRSNSSKLLP